MRGVSNLLPAMELTKVCGVSNWITVCRRLSLRLGLAAGWTHPYGAVPSDPYFSDDLR
jgi:hypothetical protein